LEAAREEFLATAQPEKALERKNKELEDTVEEA
jgi:hypothetical protein